MHYACAHLSDAILTYARPFWGGNAMHYAEVYSDVLMKETTCACARITLFFVASVLDRNSP